MRAGRTPVLVTSVMMGAVLLATSLSLAQAPSTPRKGGVVRIGNLGEPPTLDAHWTTATLTEVLANHLYEGLYALDDGYRPIPMLAESMPAVSADGLTYTIKLRSGIKFHNSKEMTSDDVVASSRGRLSFCTDANDSPSFWRNSLPVSPSALSTSSRLPASVSALAIESPDAHSAALTPTR